MVMWAQAKLSVIVSSESAGTEAVRKSQNEDFPYLPLEPGSSGREAYDEDISA